MTFAIPRTSGMTIKPAFSSNNIVDASWHITNYTSLATINNKTYLDFLNNSLNKTYGTVQKPDFLHLALRFDRNFSIYTIMIPLVAIFILLGGIFLLPVSEVSNRLTMTLGIFAFLFTFAPIIDGMKPLSVHNPTIADFLISVTMIATIVFSVFSIGGFVLYRKYKNKFTGAKWWILIDGIAFLIVLFGILFYNPMIHYPIDITIWLIPTILVSLGYGLIGRILK